MSPLDYPRFGTPAQRFVLFETDASPPSPTEVYFAPTQQKKRNKSGDPMYRGGKPVMVTVPGADPDVLGFIDYHEWMPGHIYIDYVATRSDWRGMGVMKTLLDEFFAANEYAKVIDFGDIYAEQLHKYFDRKRESPEWRNRVRGKIW
jgi:ribosomal protein S18 acetylase RimI-like enzyme